MDAGIRSPSGRSRAVWGRRAGGRGRLHLLGSSLLGCRPLHGLHRAEHGLPADGWAGAVEPGEATSVRRFRPVASICSSRAVAAVRVESSSPPRLMQASSTGHTPMVTSSATMARAAEAEGFAARGIGRCSRGRACLRVATSSGLRSTRTRNIRWTAAVWPDRSPPRGAAVPVSPVRPTGCGSTVLGADQGHHPGRSHRVGGATLSHACPCRPDAAPTASPHWVQAGSA